jgi:hypothetical protein
MHTDTPRDGERADLAAWRRRHGLRRGSRTTPIPGGQHKRGRAYLKQQAKQQWQKENHR